MNLLQVVGSCGGGVGRHVRSLCQELVEREHRLSVVYTPHDTDHAFERFVEEWRDRIRFFPLEVRREISPPSDLRAIIRLLRLMRREGPFDVVHGHSAKGGAIARVAGCMSGVPTVYTPHSLIASSPTVTKTKAAVYTSIELLLGWLATSKMIAVSSEEFEFIKKLRLVPVRCLALIENGIGERELDSISSRKDAPKDLEGKPLIFGSTMRFEEQKAPGHLVEAFIRLSESLPLVPAKLVIAGDGKLFDEVKKRVEESGMEERILLLGWRDDAWDLLGEFDVFVMSSLYEGFSYSLLEAMAAKLPIVSTEVFGVSDTIARIPGNEVVPVGDPEALARAMGRSATKRYGRNSLGETLREIGQANHDYVRAHFKQSKANHRALELYRALQR